MPVGEADRSLWIQEDKLSPSEQSWNGDFGQSVDLAGGTLAVGAPGVDQVFVYERANGAWTLAATLESPQSGTGFGEHVAMDAAGDTLAVGAPFAATGSVHIYQHSTDQWTLQDTLHAGEVQAWDLFGDAIDLSNDGTTLLVGAFARDTPAGENAGTAYVFDQTSTGWEQTANLTASDAGFDDRFGFAVALDADGARLAISTVQQQDTVYVFGRTQNGWTQDASLSDGRGFGASVDLSAGGETLVVGDDREETISVLKRSEGQWTKAAKLRPADASPFSGGERIGDAVAISADASTIVVGAAGDDASPGTPTNGPDLGPNPAREWSPAGAAYVFAQTDEDWVQTAKLVPADAVPDDIFGVGELFGDAVSVSRDGNQTTIGAPRADLEPATFDVGAVYTYSRETVEAVG